MYVNGALFDVPQALLTVTFTVPAICGGEVAVIQLDEWKTTFVAHWLPNMTWELVVKLVPWISTGVPPATGPLFGLTGGFKVG